MEFPAVTYGAGPVDFSIGAAGACCPLGQPLDAPIDAPLDTPLAPARASDLLTPHFTDGLAAFLRLVAAYFQGCLASFPRVHSAIRPLTTQAPLTFIDTALDAVHEPLIAVRMNRALSRRMRWLVRRGRVQSSGRLRVYNPEAESRCNLTPGQMIEYCIRVYRESRAAAYGLNRGGRIVNRGRVLALGLALLCNAILTPD